MMQDNLKRILEMQNHQQFAEIASQIEDLNNSGVDTVARNLADDIANGIETGKNGELYYSSGEAIRSMQNALKFVGNSQLFDITKVHNNSNFGASGFAVAPTYACSDYVKVLPNKQVYASTNGTNGNNVYRIYLIGKQKNIISTTSNWVANVTTTAETFYIVVVYYVVTGIMPSAMMISYDSFKAFESYKTNNYSAITDRYSIALRNNFKMIPVVVGRELNIYFETVFTSYNKHDVYARISCPTITNGSYKNFDECFRYTPVVGDVGNHTLTFKIYEKITSTLLATTTIALVVIANTALSSPKKVLYIGDSWIGFESIQNTMKDLFGSNLSLYGTLGSGNYKHEGRGGWSLQSYAYNQTGIGGYTNPFFNPSATGIANLYDRINKFDFSYYIANNPSFSDVEYVIIHLGINDSWWDYAITTILNQLISNIKTFNTNIKIVLCGAPIAPESNGSASSLIDSEGARVNQYAGNVLMYNTYDTDSMKVNKIYIMPDKINIDSKYDYPHTTEPVSSRNTELITRYTDTNHLNTYGWQKVGDMHYCFLSWLFQQ